MDRHIPYEPPYSTRPRARPSMPVIWIAAAAVLALLLWLILT